LGRDLLREAALRSLIACRRERAQRTAHVARVALGSNPPQRLINRYRLPPPHIAGRKNPTTQTQQAR
jgi:hypothetical protein